MPSLERSDGCQMLELSVCEEDAVSVFVDNAEFWARDGWPGKDDFGMLGQG